VLELHLFVIISAEGFDKPDGEQVFFHAAVHLVHGFLQSCEPFVGEPHGQVDEQEQDEYHTIDDEAEAGVDGCGQDDAPDGGHRGFDEDAHGAVHRLGHLLHIAGHAGDE